jgi:hypothetical protein
MQQPNNNQIVSQDKLGARAFIDSAPYQNHQPTAAGFNWQEVNRKLYRANYNQRQRNQHRLWMRAYLRNNCNASATALDIGMSARNFERYKAKWRACGIHVPTHNHRHKNTDNLSGVHPYALKATKTPALENTATGANSVLRNTPQVSYETTVTGTEHHPPAHPRPILPLTPRRVFTAAEKNAFSQQLHALLSQRRIRITPQECGRLLGIGIARLPDATGHTLFAFLAGRLRSPALRNPFAYAIRCILTRQRAGHSPPGAPAAPAADPCRPPTPPVDPSAAFGQLRGLAAASPPVTGKSRIGSFSSAKGILRL